MITIIIGGDVCPRGEIQNAFVNGNASQIFNDLLVEIIDANFSVVNLECPLILKETPITKAGSPGSILGADIKCVKGFVTSKWDVLNLANNHSFDHGAIGLQGTIEAIKHAGLDVVGVGLNISEAQIPLIKYINGERIVIYSMAEREYSIADEKTPGANPLDLINFVNAIRIHKQQGSFIVLMHGGKEHYPYPSPEMIRRCHFMVDMGADAVICCHTHCPLPWEIYADRPIVYGLGNLVFEASKPMQEAWYEGYLAKLKIEKKQIYLETIPYLQSKTFLGAQKMTEDQQRMFYEKMQRKIDQVKDGSFIASNWMRHCQQQKEKYLIELFGYNRIMRKAHSLLLRWYSKNEVLTSLHLSQCETHQEVLSTIFKCERQDG